MFVFIKTKCPRCVLENLLSSSIDIVVQVDEDVANIGDQVSHIKENGVDNTIGNGGINRLI